MTRTAPHLGRAGCQLCAQLAKTEEPHWLLLDATPSTATFYCLRQRAPGSVIIVPQRHVAMVTDLPEEEFQEVMIATQKAARIIEELFDPDALSVWSDSGEIADQPFEHACVEIVPRHKAVPYQFSKFSDLPAQQPEVLVEQARRYRSSMGYNAAP